MQTKTFPMRVYFCLLGGWGGRLASVFASPPFTLGNFWSKSECKRKVCARNGKFSFSLRLRQVAFTLVFTALASAFTSLVWTHLKRFTSTVSNGNIPQSLLRRRANARNISKTPYSTGEKHTIATFVDQTHILLTRPRRKNSFFQN